MIGISLKRPTTSLRVETKYGIFLVNNNDKITGNDSKIEVSHYLKLDGK
jgi:hypothetical protein